MYGIHWDPLLGLLELTKLLSFQEDLNVGVLLGLQRQFQLCGTALTRMRHITTQCMQSNPDMEWRLNAHIFDGCLSFCERKLMDSLSNSTLVGDFLSQSQPVLHLMQFMASLLAVFKQEQADGTTHPLLLDNTQPWLYNYQLPNLDAFAALVCGQLQKFAFMDESLLAMSDRWICEMCLALYEQLSWPLWSHIHRSLVLFGSEHEPLNSFFLRQANSIENEASYIHYCLFHEF